MSGFLVSAACKGRRPKRFEKCSVVSRPDLIARLLRDRGVARFLVAPSGFGKTHLMLEYAEVVFSLRHTFWVRCESPCFLRDLDAGVIAHEVKRIDASPSLIVFDDVPDLNAERADAFSEVVDDLLASGNEVIVACTSPSDAYAERHRDRLKLGPTELLLADQELKAVPARGDSDSVEGRIACVAWGNDDGSAYLPAFAADEPSSSMVLVAFLVLAFGPCALDDVRSYVPDAPAREALERAHEDYPFLGADCAEAAFRPARVDARVLARAFSRRFDDIARRAMCANVSELACRIADDLVKRGFASRGCTLMGSLATKGACATWLADNGRALFEAGCFKAAHELFVLVDKRAAPCRARLAADESFRLLALDDASTAAYLAERLAFSRQVAPEVRAGALVVSAVAGCDASRARRAQTIRGLSQLRRWETAMGPDACPKTLSAVLRLARAFDAGPSALVRESLSLSASEDGQDVAVAGAYLAFSGLARAAGNAPADDSPGAALADGLAQNDVERLALWALRFLAASERARSDADESVLFPELPTASRSWMTLRMAAALARSVEAGVLSERFSPDKRICERAHKAEVALFAQRAAYRRDAICEQRAAAAGEFPSGGRFAAQPPLRLEARKARAPMLYVGLFGGLDVRIGGVPVDPVKLSRQKAKTLLALLVLNRGRELSRARLLSLLWPALSPDAAQKSFYTVWSQLRRALEWEGSCPYLVRDQCGVHLNAHLLESDVADFEAMCRELSFGPIDADGWQAHLASIGGEFSQELLPSETGNECIAAARLRFRSDLTDALVAASSRLSEAGEPRAALWFAREAVRRDGAREDAYAALMQAQIDSGQRAAALDTYFSCRRYLADELGIDPSVALVALYRSVIGSVEVLA